MSDQQQIDKFVKDLDDDIDRYRNFRVGNRGTPMEGSEAGSMELEMMLNNLIELTETLRSKIIDFVSSPAMDGPENDASRVKLRVGIARIDEVLDYCSA